MHTANAVISSRWLLRNTFHYADLIRVQYIRFSEGCKGRTFVPLGFIWPWTYPHTAAPIPEAQGRRTRRPTSAPGRARSPCGENPAAGRLESVPLPAAPPAPCPRVLRQSPGAFIRKKSRHSVLITTPKGQRPIFLHPGDGGKPIRWLMGLLRGAPGGAHRFSRHSSRMDWRGAVPAKEALTRISPQR